MRFENLTWIDLSLITAALAIFFFSLNGESSKEQLVSNSIGHFSKNRSISICSYALIILTITLAWLGFASVDAFGSTAFVLTPVFMRGYIQMWNDLMCTFAFSSNPSLTLRNNKISYMRIGKPCGAVITGTMWRTTFNRGQSGTKCDCNCTAHFYVLREPGYNRESLLTIPFKPFISAFFFISRLFGSILLIDNWTLFNTFSLNDVTAIRPGDIGRILTDITSYGLRVGHTRHCVLIENKDFGMEFIWWARIIPNISLSHMSFLMGLTSKQFISALGLLTDIFRIGDLVLHFRRPYIKNQFKRNENLKHSLRETQVNICKLLIDLLKLQSWPSVTLDMTKEGFQWPKNREAEYSMLFYLLAQSSDHFSKPITTDLTVHNVEPDPDDPTASFDVINSSESFLNARRPRKLASDLFTMLLSHSEDILDSDIDTEVCKLIDDWLYSWGQAGPFDVNQPETNRDLQSLPIDRQNGDHMV